MKNKCISVTILTLCLHFSLFLQMASAQKKDAPKLEVGAQFTSLSITDPFSGSLTPERKFSYPGIGGRFTYNVTDNFALEAEANVFLREDKRGFSRLVGGYPAQALFGVKAGKRFGKIGVFGKARPGFINFSKIISSGLGGSGDATSRRTHFAADIGGVFEFYPSRRIVTRFDLGDTVIRYGDEQIAGASIPIEGAVKHNLQFSAGVGFRF